MRWRLVGVALGLAFYAGLWVCVAAGATGLRGLLITVPVLVLLVAGGNWLQHGLGIRRRAPQFSQPPADAEPDDAGSSPS
jgi:hypothetical protein